MLSKACERLETVPASVWRGPVRRCFQGSCEWSPGPENARPPAWLVKLRDDFAKRAGYAMMKPALRAIRPSCANTFGGRWFPEHNGIGVLLHDSASTTYGVAVHELTHWLQWVKYGDEPGEHDKRFFALLEHTYPAYNVSLKTAKEIENGYYPAHWAAESWAEVRRRSPYRRTVPIPVARLKLRAHIVRDGRSGATSTSELRRRWARAEAVLRSREAMRLLRTNEWGLEKHEDPWTTGGCLTLATVVARHLGGRIVVFVNHPPNGTAYSWGHAAVKVGNVFIDGLGLHPSEDSFRRAWRAGPEISIEAYDPGRDSESLSCHSYAVAGLLRLLEKR